jgi:probable rRNA maturation factor
MARGGVAAAVRALDEGAREIGGACPPGELSVALLSDRGLALLHGRFLGDPSATDVITFPGDRAHGTAGEICVSVDAAARRAGRSGRRLSAELALYIAHGWLHLAGFDDKAPAKRRAMRLAEGRALRALGRRGALPRFKLA